MFPIYTITTFPSHLGNATKLEAFPEYHPAYQARPGDLLPVVIETEQHVQGELMYWGLKSTTAIRMEKILTRSPYNVMIRAQRAVIPANCFFGRRDGQAFLIKLIQERTFGMGGIYQPAKKPSGKGHFVPLTVEAPDFLSPYSERIPVLFTLSEYEEWLLTPELKMVMEMADQSAHRWFDLFPVDNAIFQGGHNDKALLRPQGPSLNELRQQRGEQKRVNPGKFRPKRGK